MFFVLFSLASKAYEIIPAAVWFSILAAEASHIFAFCLVFSLALLIFCYALFIFLEFHKHKYICMYVCTYEWCFWQVQEYVCIFAFSPTRVGFLIALLTIFV